MKIPPVIRQNAMYIVFAQALISMLGSLYFSEIANIPPCVLCWYQRTAIYPIVLLAAVSIWYGDKKVYRYILPLGIIGGLISIYHNLLTYHVIPEVLQTCRFGVPCTQPTINWLGFITIPLLSFLSFVMIIAFTWLSKEPTETA